MAEDTARGNMIEALPGFFLEPVTPPAEKAAPKVPVMARGEMVYQTMPEPELGVQRAFFGQFNKAMTYLPDAAINLAMRGMEAAGVVDAPEDPAQNRNFLERAFNAANFKQKEQILGFLNVGVPGTEIPETSLAEKAAGAAGAATAFAAPVVGAMSRGARGPSFTGVMGQEISRRAMEQPGVATMAPELVRQSVASFATRPAAVATAEAAASAVGAAAGEAEQQLLGFQTGIPALVSGAYTGALVENPLNTLKATVTNAPFPLAQAGVKGYQFVKNRWNDVNDPERAAAVVKSRIQPELQKAIDEATARGDLQRADELRAAFEAEGVTPPSFTLAERTLDIPLQQTQQLFQKRAGAEDARMNMERINNNIRSAFEFAVKTFPTAGDAPAQVVVQKDVPERFIEAATERRNILGRELGAEEEAIADETRDLINKFPSANRQARMDRGTAIQQQLVDMKNKAKEDLLKLADDLGLNAQTEPKSIADLQAVLRTNYPDMSITEGNVPGVVKTIRNFSGPGVNFQEYRDLRQQIGAEMGDAASKGFSEKLGKLEIVKAELDKWASRNFGDNYAAWREAYTNGYQIPFENGIVYKVTQELPGSRPGAPVYALQGELVANEIFKQADKGRLGDVQKYLRLIEDDIPAMNNMRNVVLDEALDRSVKNGTVDPTKLQTFVNRNEPVLRQLGIYEELVDTNKAAAVLSTRATALAERTKAIKKDQLVKVLDSAAERGQTPEEVVDELLNKPDQLGKFYTRLQSLDDPGLVEAFRAAAMNRVLSTMEQGPDAFTDAMVRYQKPLEKILTPEGFRNVAIVNDALYRIRFAEKGVEGGGINPESIVSQIEANIGTKIPSIGSYMRAMVTNKQSATFLALLLGKNFVSAQQQKAFDQMMTRAIYDTDFARDLATPVGPTGAVPRPVELRVRGAMFSSMVPDLTRDAEPVEVTYDPETKTFRSLSGEPVRAQGQTPTPEVPERGIPAFDVAPRAVAPLAPLAPAAPVAPPAMPTAPAASAPEGNVITVRPQQRSSLDYEMLFPNDMLGSMISKQG